MITAEETEVYQANAKNTKNIITTRRNDKFQIVAAVEDNTKLSLLYYEDDSKRTFSEIRILVSIKIVFSTSYLFNN